MDRIELFGGLLLPWLLGMAIMTVLRARASTPDVAKEIAWIAGTGYFVGAFVLTLWMRLLSLSNIPFGIATIAVPLAIATLLLGAIAMRRDRSLFTVAIPAALRALVASPQPGGAGRALWWLLIGWMMVRFVLLGLEITWRPLYPWDAWIQWATKSRVWYELSRIAPFVRGPEWFAAKGSVYMDAFPEYPPTIPLLQVWANIALGRWDDALMNWPWWQIALALTLAVYGGLRRLGTTPIYALVGAFMVSSLPLVNVHVALAGYADLPLGAYFTAAVLAMLCWNTTRTSRDAWLALLLLLACIQIKNPGIYWVLSVIPGFVVALFPQRGLKLAAIAAGVTLLLLAVLAQTRLTLFNQPLHLAFDPAWRSLGESTLLLGNWNLLWYGLIGILILARRQLIELPLAPFTVVIGFGLLFLFVLFAFGNARELLAPQVTVNRATLHLAPLIAIYLVLSFHVFAARWSAAHAARPALATPAAAGAAPVA